MSLYKHYKGGVYDFITQAFDSDTGEEKAVFRNVETGVAWIRPLQEFQGTVEVDGQTIPRFTPVD